MADEKKLFIGIDLGSRYIQASYMIEGMEEPESVILGFASQTYYIPTVGYKKKGENKWAFGDTGKNYFENGEYLKVEDVMDKVLAGDAIELDEETYMPVDILECLLRFVVRECIRVADIEKIDKIAVCLDKFNKKLLDNVKFVLKRMDFTSKDILLMNRTESFVYYSLNAGEELYKRGVGLYDFSGKRLTYSYMNYAPFMDKKTVVMVDSTTERVQSVTEGEVDKELAQAAGRLAGSNNMSAVYLTGDGFETYGNLDKFIQAACYRKRAFVGQNLYAKGAAQGAFEYFYGGNYKNRILACEDRILADFDIDIVERETAKVYRAVKAGTNWYMAAKRLRFVVNDVKEIIIHVKPIEKKPDQDVVIPLDEFPGRPEKMTKVMLEIGFSSASACKVCIKDMGFGDIYKSTGKAIYRDIKL